MPRLLNLLEYALLSLTRRWKKQAFLVLIYAIVVGFFASVIFFTASLQKETEVVLEDVPELWIQQLAGGRLEPMPETFAESLQQLRGVKKVIPRIWGYLYDTPTGAVFTVIGSDSLTQGLTGIEMLENAPLDSNQAICGTGFLELRGLYPWERLTIAGSKGNLFSFDIIGSFKAGTDLLTRDLIILSPESARQVLALPAGHITDVALSVYNPQEVDNIGQKIDQQFSGIRVVSKSQLQSTYRALFGWRGGIFVYGALVSVLAFLILAWDRAAGLSSGERREIGILKGIGWEISDVLWMKFWEGLVISATASLSGILLAYLHVFVLDATLLKPFLIGWSVMYPAYELQPVVTFGDILLILSIAVIPYLSATIVPSWKGAITDPAEVMQG